MNDMSMTQLKKPFHKVSPLDGEEPLGLPSFTRDINFDHNSKYFEPYSDKASDLKYPKGLRIEEREDPFFREDKQQQKRRSRNKL